MVVQVLRYRGQLAIFVFVRASAMERAGGRESLAPNCGHFPVYLMLKITGCFLKDPAPALLSDADF